MQDILAHAQPLVVDDKLKGLVPFLPLNLPPPGRPAPPPPPPSTAAAPGLSQGAGAMNRIAIAAHRAARGAG